MEGLKADFLYYDKSSPVRYGSKSKILQYLRTELRKKNINREQYVKSVKDVKTLAKKIDLGTHFQRHRKKWARFITRFIHTRINIFKWTWWISRLMQRKIMGLSGSYFLLTFRLSISAFKWWRPKLGKKQALQETSITQQHFVRNSWSKRGEISSVYPVWW